MVHVWPPSCWAPPFRTGVGCSPGWEGLAFSRRPGLGATGPRLQQKSLSWQMRGARPRLSHLGQGPGAPVWAEAELLLPSRVS